jgi:hypothetical protein
MEFAMPPKPPQDPPFDLDAIAARFRAQGIVPPDDRAHGTYANAARMLGNLHWLRRPRPLGAEPAHMMSLKEWTE